MAADDLMQPYFYLNAFPVIPKSDGKWSLDPRLIPLWRKALRHDENELHRKIAHDIIYANKQGHVGIEATRPELLLILAETKTHPATRFAVARALVALETRDASAALLAAAQSDSDLRQFVEPVLAQWRFAPATEVWRQRLAASNTPRRDLVLAAQAVAEIGDAGSLKDLVRIATNRGTASDIRLVAARAAGQIADSGLEADADALLSLASANQIDRLVVVGLITKHHSPAIIAKLQTLAVDAEAAVAGGALRALFLQDPSLVLPVAEVSLVHADANVRQVAIETYLKLPTLERLSTLTARMNDLHPGLREMVRRGLFTYAQDATYESMIRERAMQILGGDDWRGQEQTAILLAALKQESVAPRLVDLLESPRFEVMVSTAWALKILKVPATCDPITEKLKRSIPLFDRTRVFRGSRHGVAIGDQLAHLCEALGVMRYKPAMPILRTLIPKDLLIPPISRATGVWAIGQIYEDRDDSELAQAFMARAEDTMSMPPETIEVQRASLLALGSMRAKEVLPRIKKLLGPTADFGEIDAASQWAVERISGEVIPHMPTTDNVQVGWSLEPIDPPKPPKE